jgi:hypothetical protein
MQTTIARTAEELLAFDRVECSVELEITYDVQPGEDGDRWTPPYPPAAELVSYKLGTLEVYDPLGDVIPPSAVGHTAEEITSNLQPLIEEYVHAIPEEDVLEHVVESLQAAEDDYWDALRDARRCD